MKPIGLYDFYDMFAAARSFAVVGNAGTILSYDNGVLIDSYDVVVRFNCAYTAGVEKQVGARTDIVCANIGKNLAECPSPATTLQPRCLVHFATKTPRDGNCEPDTFADWAGDLPTLITWAPDLIGVTQGARTRQLTQGTYALYTLLRLFKVERLFVTGFTMYQPTTGTPLKYFGPSVAKVGIHHDLDEEARIVATILGAFDGDLQVTPEVQALLVRHSGNVRLRCGFLGQPGAANQTTLLERLRGRIAWQLISWGFAMRRSLEERSAVDFRAYLRGKRERREADLDE